MKLYHSTKTTNVESILERGLIPNGMGIVYLAPTLETVNKSLGQSILEVETGDLRLSAFEDCKEWEVFCWGYIPSENVRLINGVHG